MADVAAARKAGKWAELLEWLDKQPGILVAPAAVAARLRADRPDRDVRDDEAVQGAVRTYAFENLPLHLYTRAERRRASS